MKYIPRIRKQEMNINHGQANSISLALMVPYRLNLGNKLFWVNESSEKKWPHFETTPKKRSFYPHLQAEPLTPEKILNIGRKHAYFTQKPDIRRLGGRLSIHGDLSSFYKRGVDLRHITQSMGCFGGFPSRSQKNARREIS